MHCFALSCTFLLSYFVISKIGWAFIYGVCIFHQTLFCKNDFKMSLVNVIFVLSRLPCQLESLCNTRINILTNIIEETLNIIWCQMCGVFFDYNLYTLFYHIFVNWNKIVLCVYFINWLTDIELSVIKKMKPPHLNFWSYSRTNEKLDMSFDTMTKDNQS